MSEASVAAPDWWAPILPTAEQKARRPAIAHHVIMEEETERWLWRYIRMMQPRNRAWLFDPANVRGERSIEFGSGTPNNAYWCHRWRLFRVADGTELAHVYVTSYFRYVHSSMTIDDGTDKRIDVNDVPVVARAWDDAVEKGAVFDF